MHYMEVTIIIGSFIIFLMEECTFRFVSLKVFNYDFVNISIYPIWEIAYVTHNKRVTVDWESGFNRRKQFTIKKKPINK